MEGCCYYIQDLLRRDLTLGQLIHKTKKGSGCAQWYRCHPALCSSAIIFLLNGTFFVRLVAEFSKSVVKTGSFFLPSFFHSIGTNGMHLCLRQGVRQGVAYSTCGPCEIIFSGRPTHTVEDVIRNTVFFFRNQELRAPEH